MFRKTMLISLLGVLMITVPADGAELPGEVKAALDKAQFKVYPGAVYCTGNLQVGVRFATSDAPEKVRAWYRKQYPDWSLQDQYGMWSLYDGPPGQGLGAIMSTRNMSIQHNAQVPGWHSLPANMTTEILIAAP